MARARARLLLVMAVTHPLLSLPSSPEQTRARSGSAMCSFLGVICTSLPDIPPRHLLLIRVTDRSTYLLPPFPHFPYTIDPLDTYTHAMNMKFHT